MLVIPAIDLKDGQAVRLFKGDYQQKTVYSDHPEELAQKFEQAGAKLLHVLALDRKKLSDLRQLFALQGRYSKHIRAFVIRGRLS